MPKCCFGSAGNFSGQIGERALKGIIKDHAARTQNNQDHLQSNVQFANMREMS